MRERDEVKTVSVWRDGAIIAYNMDIREAREHCAELKRLGRTAEVFESFGVLAIEGVNPTC